MPRDGLGQLVELVGQLGTLDVLAHHHVQDTIREQLAYLVAAPDLLRQDRLAEATGSPERRAELHDAGLRFAQLPDDLRHQPRPVNHESRPGWHSVQWHRRSVQWHRRGVTNHSWPVSLRHYLDRLGEGWFDPPGVDRHGWIVEILHKRQGGPSRQ